MAMEHSFLAFHQQALHLHHLHRHSCPSIFPCLPLPLSPCPSLPRFRAHLQTLAPLRQPPDSTNHNLSRISDSGIAASDYPHSWSPADGTDDRQTTDVPQVFKSRNKHVWVKPGVNVDEVQRITRMTSKDEWENEAKYSSENADLSWPKRSSAIVSVVDADEPAPALSKARSKLALVDYNTILRRLATQRKWREVFLVFEWMKQNEKLSPPSFTSFISSMGKAGYPQRALRAFKYQSDREIRLNAIVCNALFKALVYNGKVEAAFVLFEQLKMEGFVPNFDTYKTLIAGCAKHRGAYAKAESFLLEMSTRGFKPDSFIFSSLLSVCASFGLEKEAKATFEKMKVENVTANSFHYCSLLNLYAETRQPDEAEKVLSDIQKAGVTLDKTILGALLKVYTNSGLLEKARKLFDDMESLSQGFPLQEVSYCLMMDAYVKGGKVDEAQRLFDKLKAKGVMPGCYAYGIMISSYSKLGKVDIVESLVGELENKPREDMDLVLFNNLLKTYCELGIMNGILKTLKKMDEAEVAPDRATFNILIHYFCKEELIDLALRTLQDLHNRRLRPNLNSYAPIILGLVNSGKVGNAIAAYNEMKKLNIIASHSVFEALIKGLLKINEEAAALKYLKEMKAIDMSPQSAFLESLLIVTAGNIDFVNEIFDVSTASNQTLKEVNFDAVLKSYEEQRFHEALPKLLEYMKEHGCVASKEVLNHVLKRLDAESHSEVMRLSQPIPEIVNKASVLL